MMPDAVIHTRELSFYFGRFQALNRINLEVLRNSIYGFLGPNGAGKTTMIKAILGLLKTPVNTVHLFGRELTAHRREVLEEIGTMVENPSLYPALSGFENVEIIRILRKLPGKETERVLEKVGLAADTHRKAGQYSTGMKQRLALAIALLGKPELLILDEPMNGLDPAGIIEIREFLLELNRLHSITILLSSHILSEIEKLATHIGIIDHGVLKFQGTMEELHERISGTGRVFFATSDNIRAIEILRSAEKKVEAVHKGFDLLAAGDADIAESVRILVEKGVGIYEVLPESSDLEDLFINVIKTQL